MKQILVFIMFSTILCWIMFSPVYKHIVILRQALLQQEVDYLLEVGASGQYGYISNAMQHQSRQRLASFGLQPDLLEYDINSTTGKTATLPTQPIMRGDGITLQISYPYERLFTIDELIGITPLSPSAKMKAVGVKMSEYVN